MKRAFLSLFMAAAMLPLGAVTTGEFTNTNNGEKYLTVESDLLQVHYNAAKGGGIRKFFFKPAGVDLTDPESKTQGTATENVWNIATSRFFLKNKPFVQRVIKNDGAVTVQMTGHHEGGGINFLEVCKDYTVKDGSAVLTIDYTFRNLPEAMSTVNYGFWMHHALGVLQAPGSYFYPQTGGIEVAKPTQDIWLYRPSRGWIATANKDGDGVAVTMSFPELKIFYGWFASMKVPTVEWHCVEQAIEEGGEWKTTVQYIPFRGMEGVSGAGNGLVGFIKPAEENPEPEESTSVEVRLWNGNAGDVEIELFRRDAAKEKWRSIDKRQLKFAKGASLQKYALEVGADDDMLVELEAVISQNGKEMARLNAAIPFGEPGRKWSIEPLEASKASSVKSIDLTRYNKPVEAAFTPWAKPLSVRKPKVLMLTQGTSMPELLAMGNCLEGEFDMSFMMVAKDGKLADPKWALGDNFGFTNTVDVENNALKQLKKKYDVVVVAGIPWTVLSDDAVAALLEQVRGGTGLLLIGKQPNQPFVKNAGAAVRGIPVFKAASPASSGVPFDTFTQLSSLSFPVTEGVLAVNGAAPALIEGTMGKGRWLFYNYDTTNSFGWAPEYSAFPDKIERTEADFHYAMLAKGILYAAGIKLPVELGDFTAAEGKAALKVNAAAPVKANAEVRVLSTGGVCTASARIPVALKAGEQTIDFGAMLPKYDGKQIFSVILRDEAGKSLNWGAWSFTNAAPARIISVSTGGKTQFVHGDNVEWSAQLNAGEGFKLRAELVDSYQRVIARQESAAAAKAAGVLKLENAMLSRSARLRLTLWDGETEIDRGEVALLTRPAEALLDWDDYEVCTWINLGVRKFLWPEMSEMMRRFRLRTIISNTGRYGVELPVQYNFHPTVLRGSGLYRCPEPAEYAKTGNKLALVRKPCISNHEHISSLAKKFVTYGKDSYAHSMRFIWLGDELSLTGYGGAPTDFCFSPDCQEALREFLKKKYTTLEKLNSVWNTSFAKWEDVISSTKDEIWKGDGKNVVSWSDRLEFLDGQVENLIAAALKSGQTQDPGMRLSLSGTQKPSAYGGTDWYRLCRQLTTLMNYNGAGSYELHRSFSSRALLAPWALGYSNRGAAVPHNIWNSVLLGNYGISAWHYPTMVNPDFTLFDGMESAVPHLQKLSDGLGRYLLNHQQGKAKVAVLYSQASMRNAFIRHRTEANDAIREKYILMLRTLGVHFDFVSYEHLAKGLPEQYTVLILPDSNALSQAEVDSVRAFKGAVMAEGIPGEYHADCRPRDKAPLSDVMAKKGNLLIPAVDVSYNKKALYPATDANYADMSAELNRLGKFLADAGVAVRPMKAVDTANGKVVVDASCYVREAADGAKLYGIVTTTMAQRMIKFSFPEKGHLYDVVTGAYLGHTDSVELPFSKGQPRAFVFRKDKLEIKSCKADGETVKVALNKSGSTVCRVRVFDPAGKEVVHYARNLDIFQGGAEYRIPFVISDAKGTWKVEVTDVVGGSKTEVSIKR